MFLGQPQGYFPKPLVTINRVMMALSFLCPSTPIIYDILIHPKNCRGISNDLGGGGRRGEFSQLLSIKAIILVVNYVQN